MWLGVDCLNLFGISNVNSYYWITDVTNNQYAVPNYLTGRQINARLSIDFNMKSLFAFLLLTVLQCFMGATK